MAQKHQNPHTELQCPTFHFTTVSHRYFTERSWNPPIFNAWKHLSVPSAMINFVVNNIFFLLRLLSTHLCTGAHPRVTVPYTLLYLAINGTNGNIWQCSLPCPVSWASKTYKISPILSEHCSTEAPVSPFPCLRAQASTGVHLMAQSQERTVCFPLVWQN